MLKSTARLVAILLFSLPSFGQGAAPHASMAKYEPMLGNWVGRGFVRETAESEPIAWVAVQSVTKVFGGQFVQTDMRIEFDGAPSVLEFREILGWDRKHDRPQHVIFSNAASAEVVDSRFVDDNTLVSVRHGWMDQVSEVERTTLTFGAGAYTMKMDRARGSEPMFTHVEGRFVKGERTFSARSPEANIVFLEEADGHMGRIAVMTGNYTFQGWTKPNIAGEKLNIEGANGIETIFGGHVLTSHISGNLIGSTVTFETWTYTTWSADKKCYVSVALDGGGGMSISEARWNGAKQLLYTGVNTQIATPRMRRRVLDLEDDGTLATLFGDSLFGSAEPYRDLQISFAVGGPETSK